MNEIECFGNYKSMPKGKFQRGEKNDANQKTDVYIIRNDGYSYSDDEYFSDRLR